MRKAIFLAGLVLALVTLAVFLPGSARSAAHGTSLPVQGRVANHVTIDLNTGALQTVETPLPFPHLGLRSAVSEGTAFPDGQGGFNIFANVIGTTANGDHLYAVTTNDLLTITGGTGRLEGVSGYLITVSQEVTNVVISPDGILTLDIAGYAEGVLNLNEP